MLKLKYRIVIDKDDNKLSSVKHSRFLLVRVFVKGYAFTRVIEYYL